MLAILLGTYVSYKLVVVYPYVRHAHAQHTIQSQRLNMQEPKLGIFADVLKLKRTGFDIAKPSCFV